MSKISLAVFLVIVAIVGIGYYLYEGSPQQMIQPSPSTTEVPSPADSAQPTIQKTVIDDLAKRLAIDPNTISIVKTEQQNWSDGSLNCPVPGRVYTQATTSGYEVILQNSSKNYVYHISSLSHFVYCDPEETYRCTEDSQCGLNICDCKAMFSSYINPQDKVCTRACEGTPKCINNKCQLFK